MSDRSAVTALALVCLTVPAACGSGSGKHATTRRTVATASATTSASAATHSTGAETSRPPMQVLDDAAAALAHAHGYMMEGAITQDGQRLALKLSTTSATALQLAFSIGNSTADLIGLPSGSYIQGNAAFWRSQAGALGARLANRWIEIPPSDARTVTSSLGSLAPATLARCLTEDHGTLTIAGKTTVGGDAAILLKDAGNVPGSSPGVLAVAATGVPYPLRYTTTGNQHPGGRIDVCNDGKASDARGTISFSQFGHVPPIHPPRSARQAAVGPNV